MNKNKINTILLSCFLIAVCWYSPETIWATEILNGDDISISRDEVIDDDLYMFGNYSEVRGTITGDLTAFCYDLSANGNIEGNANIFAYNIDFIGKIDRTARLFAYKIRLNGPVKGNLMAFANDMKLGSKTYISKDFTYFGENIKIDGTILGNVNGESEKTVISGRIDGDISIETDQLIIISPATITGELSYTSANEAIIEEGVIIEDEIIWNKAGTETDDDIKLTDESSFLGNFILFLAALLTGFVLILLFKNHINRSVEQLETNFWHTFAIGCLSFLGLTLGWIIPAVLIIGIPVSIMMLTLGLILFYIGKIYVSITLARYLFGLMNKGTKLPIGIELIVGLIILTVLFELPVIGWVIYIATFLLGSGAAINGCIAISRSSKTAQYASPIE
ncbi:MAG: polymer-forming cytoskeletal protein [candidate division Zixibacteria bacterium]|nr:polymer-forming cytoskeletal protein [candidate division Zixibacteria bacterium]